MNDLSDDGRVFNQRLQLVRVVPDVLLAVLGRQEAVGAGLLGHGGPAREHAGDQGSDVDRFEKLDPRLLQR